MDDTENADARNKGTVTPGHRISDNCHFITFLFFRYPIIDNCKKCFSVVDFLDDFEQEPASYSFLISSRIPDMKKAGIFDLIHF